LTELHARVHPVPEKLLTATFKGDTHIQSNSFRILPRKKNYNYA